MTPYKLFVERVRPLFEQLVAEGIIGAWGITGIGYPDTIIKVLGETPQGTVYDKVMSNLEEIKARGGPVIAIACEDDTHVAERADDIIHVPAVPDYLQPLVVAIPLQFLAYHMALLRGCDIDKPRNLAKSVTVE